MRVRTHTNPLNIIHRFTNHPLTRMIHEKKTLCDIEIGPGRGNFLRDWTKKNPHKLTIGIETRKQMATFLQESLNETSYKNTHIVYGNGHFFIQDAVPDQCIKNLFIFHPDPWLKKRHHKRRILSDEFLRVCAKKLHPTGIIYLSTDVQCLWDDMRTIIDNHTQFKQIENSLFWKTHYTSHWNQFSLTKNRPLFFGSFSLNN